MTDPIFIAIDRHRFADTRWLQCQKEANQLLDVNSPEYARRRELADAQFDELSKASHALFLTQPETIAGALALLRYIADRSAAGDDLLELSALPGPHNKASVALCHRLITALTALVA